MEGFTFIIGLIIFIFGILEIILFFKIWGMTNDVRELKNHFLGSAELAFYENNAAEETTPDPEDFETIKGDFMDKPRARQFAKQVYEYHNKAKKDHYTHDTEVKGLEYIINHYGNKAASDGISPQAIVNSVIKQLDK